MKHTEETKVVLPLPPDVQAHLERRGEMEIYARFMRHLRHVPSTDMSIKILSAIQFTADMLDLNDALVSKTLVDLGLLAPRKAFPAAYLSHVDQSLMRSGFEVGGPSAASLTLKVHWDHIGEDRFAAFRVDFDVSEVSWPEEESSYVTA